MRTCVRVRICHVAVAALAARPSKVLATSGPLRLRERERSRSVPTGAYAADPVSTYPDSPPRPAAQIATGVAPPHSIEAEQSVLGGILLSDRAMYGLVIEEGLKAEDFYRDRHRAIYEAMLALYRDSEPIDVLTVSEHLRSTGKLDEVGGKGAIDELTGGVPGLGGIRRYAQIVREHALMRRLLSTTYEIQASVLNHAAAPRELVEQAERAMLEVARDDRQKDFRTIDEILDDELKKMEKLSREGTSLTGTPSGFRDLDEITGGFQPGNLIVIAARPSMGKCLNGLSLIYECATGRRRRLDELVALHESGEEVWVAALGADLRLRPARVSATFRNGVRPLFRVTTRLGRSTEVTANHPLLTLDGWKRVDELVPGSRIGVPRNLPTHYQQLPIAIWDRVLAAKGDRPWSEVSRAAGHPPNHNWHVHARGLSRPQLRKIADWSDDDELQQFATSDVWWDEIVSIEPAGEEETYDLTVPVHHNFVADDLIVHNSALVTNIAENAAIDHGMPVALFSLEMSETELAQRFVASQGRIKGDELRKGRVPDSKWPKILQASARLAAAPLYVDDSSDVGIIEIRAKARRLHQQHPLGLIIIDYLQLMRPDGRVESRVQQVGEMSRGLKILARELNVPVIALSQLSRAVETRGQSVDSKRPLLSDLRECVVGSTLVTLEDGRRLPISELVGVTPEVLAIDGADRVAVARSDKVWPVGVRRVLRMRLASGRTLSATPEHRVRTWGGWGTLGDVAVGDRVAVARSLPEPRRPERWPDDRVILLGHLIGDGSYLTHQPLRYTTASEANSAAVARAAEREFGATVRRHDGHGNWHQLVISGNGNRWHPAGVNRWLRELGIWNERSASKRVPEAAFTLANDQIALLLRHLWATDGTIWCATKANGRRANRISFATASARLAADVAALLLRCGIVARTSVLIQHTGTPLHHVTVSGARDQRRFLDVVGGFGPRSEQVSALAAMLADVEENTNVDTLPIEVRADVRARMTDRGVTQRAMAELRGTSYGGTSHFRPAPSRALATEYATLLEDPSLAAMASNDLHWDRVVAIEDGGEEQVYDLTVPGPACWLADGIVSHNSGAIEQDADLVAFIFREEYYDKETERAGIADIIIAKHRNGAIGDVELTFAKEYPKFLNYTSPDRYG